LAKSQKYYLRYKLSGILHNGLEREIQSPGIGIRSFKLRTLWAVRLVVSYKKKADDT